MSICLELDAQDCRQRCFSFCVCGHSTTMELQPVGCTSFYSFIPPFPLHFLQAKNEQLPQISSCTVTCYALVADLGTQFLHPNSIDVRTTGEERGDSAVSILLALYVQRCAGLLFGTPAAGEKQQLWQQQRQERQRMQQAPIQTVPAKSWRSMEQT